MADQNIERRIGDLEDEIKHRDRRIEELRQEIDEQRDLIRQMEGNVEDCLNTIESWKETFDMTQTDDGKWTWEPFWDEHNKIIDDYNALVRRWNRFVPLINQRHQPVGRPLAASEEQCATVIKARKAGRSLRGIAEDTGIGLNTVRTIVDRVNGSDRVTRRRWQRAHPGETWRGTYEPIGRIDDRQQQATWKRRGRTGEGLPQRAQSVFEAGGDLLKQCKGLR